jgi:hypothetical protein
LSANGLVTPLQSFYPTATSETDRSSFGVLETLFCQSTAGHSSCFTAESIEHPLKRIPVCDRQVSDRRQSIPSRTDPRIFSAELTLPPQPIDLEGQGMKGTTVMTSQALSKSRHGLALPSAMLALVAVSVLISGLFTFSDLGAKSVRNRESATRAVHVADAGVAHTLGLLRGNLRMRSFTQILRGSDDVVGTADDSLFTGWGLSAEDQIPLAGQSYQGHTYFVTVRDDPADGDVDPATDRNGRILVRCRAVTTDGATAEVEAIVAAVPMPAVAADGNLGFAGNFTIQGACGGAHANGNLTATGGGPDINTIATATGTVTGNWNLLDGSPAPRLNGQPEVVIPDLNPMDFCAGVEFRLLSNGSATTGAGVGIPIPIGWTYNAGSQTWSAAGGVLVDGTYCVQGNVSIAGSTGTAAVPKRVSVLATGSISVSGTPVIVPEHDDGILFMAAGDVAIAGNPTAGTTSYSGMVYAGAQCSASGNANMFGQLLCANGAQPAGATELIAAHSMSGNFVLTFDCSGNVFNKRRILYWYPRIGV